jgi:hypothetical protein
MSQTKSLKVGRPNLVCNVEEKTFEGKQKHGMIGQADNQVLAPGPTHGFKCV